MTAISEEKLGKYFAKSFKEVVLPVLEDMEERLASKKDIYRIEEKLEKMDERLDRQGKTQDKIEVRVETLETTIFPD
jgi:chaperonin cofactor prefoldin